MGSDPIYFSAFRVWTGLPPARATPGRGRRVRNRRRGRRRHLRAAPSPFLRRDLPDRRRIPGGPRHRPGPPHGRGRRPIPPQRLKEPLNHKNASPRETKRHQAGFFSGLLGLVCQVHSCSAGAFPGRRAPRLSRPQRQHVRQRRLPWKQTVGNWNPSPASHPSPASRLDNDLQGLACANRRIRRQRDRQPIAGHVVNCCH